MIIGQQPYEPNHLSLSLVASVVNASVSVAVTLGASVCDDVDFGVDSQRCSLSKRRPRCA